MSIKHRITAGKWVVQNLDGEEKRFDRIDSPEAKEWRRSFSKKKKTYPRYSQEWWDQQDGLTPSDRITEDEVNRPLKTFLHSDANALDDISFQGHGSKVVSGVRCATVEIRCVFNYGPDADLGNEDTVSDGVWVKATRDHKNPKKLNFQYIG